MNTIGGSMFCHNVLSLDYAVHEALFSLQGVCSEISIVDAASTDGTREWLEDCASVDPRIKLSFGDWNPKSDWNGQWLCDLANLARERLTTDYHIPIQADECLHEADYDLIREAAEIGLTYKCRRFNFWKDAWHLAPHGRVCGANIVRMGKRELPFIGDAENIADYGTAQQSAVRIYHVGFLRHDEAQARKGISMEEEFMGTHNPIYDRMKTEGRKPFDEESFPEPLIDFPRENNHPAILIPWLKERNRL